MVNIYKKGNKINQIQFEKIEWNLDKWNGHEWCYGEAWEHAGVMKIGNDWVLFEWNNTQGNHASGEVISEAKAKKLIKGEVENW